MKKMSNTNSHLDLNLQKVGITANRHEEIPTKPISLARPLRKKKQWRKSILIFVKKSEQAIQHLLQHG